MVVRLLLKVFLNCKRKARHILPLFLVWREDRALLGMVLQRRARRAAAGRADDWLECTKEGTRAGKGGETTNIEPDLLWGAGDLQLHGRSSGPAPPC